jgi:hypothetical protein
MAHVVNKLRPRHYTALHIALLGRSHVDIAFRVGMTPGHVGDVLRSPLAQAELVRLRAAAEARLATVPLEALAVTRELMNDEGVPAAVRARIACHLLDRIIFDRQAVDDEQQVTYRDILRKLDALDNLSAESEAQYPLASSA